MINRQTNKYVNRILCGILLSVNINVLHILILYNCCSEFVFDSTPFIIAILIVILIRETQLRTVFSAFGSVLLVNIITELLFMAFGFLEYFYFNANPGATEFDIGVGVLQVGLYVYELQGFLLGFLFVLFKILTKRTLRQMQSLKTREDKKTNDRF